MKVLNVRCVPVEFYLSDLKTYVNASRGILKKNIQLCHNSLFQAAPQTVIMKCIGLISERRGSFDFG